MNTVIIKPGEVSVVVYAVYMRYVPIVWLRLLPRINSFDPDFFLRSDNVLKFRIFWSVLVTAYYINP